MLLAAPGLAQEGFLFVDDYSDAALAQGSGPKLPSLNGVPTGPRVFGRTVIDPQLTPAAHRTFANRGSSKPVHRRPVPEPIAQHPPETGAKRLTLGGRISSWFSREKGQEQPPTTSSFNPQAVGQALYDQSRSRRNTVAPASRQSFAPRPRAGVASRPTRGHGIAQRPTSPSAQPSLLGRWAPRGGEAKTTAQRNSQPQNAKLSERLQAALPKPAVPATKQAPLPQPIAHGPVTRKLLPKTPKPVAIASLNKLEAVARAAVKPMPASQNGDVVFATDEVDDAVVFATDDPASKKVATQSVAESTDTGPVFVSDETIAEATPVFVSDNSTAVAPLPLPSLHNALSNGMAKPTSEACDACTACDACGDTEASSAVVAAPRPPVPPVPAATTLAPIVTPVTKPTPASVTEEKLVQAKPSKRAVEILAETRAAAARASKVEEFSRVVQQCRHVLAIDQSEAVVGYAYQLGAWALNKRGELRADAGQIRDAMADFDESLRMRDDTWRARHNRGVLHAQAGRYAEAFVDFNDVIQQQPEFAKAYSNRASLYVQAGEFEVALDDYRQAITFDPDLAVAHKGRGRVCHMLGRMEEALQHFDAAVLLAPHDAHIASCRADLLTDNARYGEAVAAYQRAIRLDPQLATAYRNLAWLRATCPDVRYRDGIAAVEQASKAIQLTGTEDDVSLDTLAAAHAAVGDFDQAVDYIRRAMTSATGADAEVYATRLELYENEQLFLSSPVSTVQQAGYQQ